MADILPFAPPGELDWRALRAKLSQIFAEQGVAQERATYVLGRLDSLDLAVRYYGDDVDRATLQAASLWDLANAFSEIYTLAHGSD